MRGLSIRVRLTLGYTLVTAILLYLWSVGLYRVASARLHAQLDALLEDRAAAVRPLFNVAHAEVKWLFEKKELERSSYRVAHAIFDDAGHFLDGSGLANVLVFPFSDAAQRALETRQSTWEILSLPNGHRIRVLDTVVTGSDGKPYLFRVGALLDQTEEDLHQLAFTLTLLVPLVLFIGAAAGWWMAGATLRPVAEITQAAQQITSAHLAERLHLRGTGDELDQLSLTLNAMIARLEASFEQMSQFISNVSHELRTPLSALRGSCEIALCTGQTEQGYRKVLADNIEELDWLARTVADLLVLARAEAGHMPLERKPENLAELVQDVVESMRVLADGREIALDCKIDGEAIAEVDAQYLLRLLVNLIDNAIKYNRPHGRVEVSLRNAGSGALISVRDTGPGIAEADLPRIFDRFFQGRAKGEQGVAGAGLGLNLARWIAVAHGGRIAVESQLGHGTTFRVWLPRKAAQQHPRAPSAEATLQAPAGAAQASAWLSNSFEGSTNVEKHVVRWSYWLGIACGVVTLVWRGLVVLGFPGYIQYSSNRVVGYSGFLNGAVLFLLIATATRSYAAATAGKT